LISPMLFLDKIWWRGMSVVMHRAFLKRVSQTRSACYK
jgi:hypothetical protein